MAFVPETLIFSFSTNYPEKQKGCAEKSGTWGVSKIAFVLETLIFFSIFSLFLSLLAYGIWNFYRTNVILYLVNHKAN